MEGAEYDYEDNHDFFPEDIDQYSLEDYENFLENYRNEQDDLALIHERLETVNVYNEIHSLATNCTITIILQSYDQLKLLLLLCFMIRCCSYVRAKFFPASPNHLLHLLNAFVGIYVIYDFYTDIFNSLISLMIVYTFLIYSSLYLLTNLNQKSGFVTSVLTISFILISEISSSSPANWHRVRGLFLTLSMKSISTAFDLDMLAEKNIPSVVEFYGYMLHPGTIMFGPWIDINTYKSSLNQLLPISLKWLFFCTESLLFACLCLLLSSCFFSYIFFDISDPLSPFILPIVASPWLNAYITAVSFHFSHFYICYLSLSTCLISGVGAKRIENKTEDDTEKKTNADSFFMWSEFKTTRPLDVEIPMSMLNVVTGWNIQMSMWLNKYVFKTTQNLGKFSSVMLTYMASAILHGLSFHLSMVLLSLGIFTYVEYVLRKKLSLIYNCPYIAARVVKKYDDSSDIKVPFGAYVFNGLWLVINLVHLAYLGSMFETEDEDLEVSGYSMYHTLQKWSNLGYFSHWLALGCYLFYLMI